MFMSFSSSMAGARPRLIWFRAIAADSSYTEFELIVAETPFILDRQDFLCLWAFCTTRLPELGWVGSLSRLCSCEGRWSPGAFITTFPYFPLLLPLSVPQSLTPFQTKLPFRRLARSVPQGTSAHSGPKPGRSSVALLHPLQIMLRARGLAWQPRARLKLPVLRW